MNPQIDTTRKMTNQEAFDIMAEWLTRPGGIKCTKDKLSSRCVYNNGYGNKCAIGVLIPDGLYDSQIDDEMFSPIGVVEKYDFMSNLNLNLLCDIQDVHDSAPRILSAGLIEIRQQLGDIASKYGLKFNL